MALFTRTRVMVCSFLHSHFLSWVWSEVKWGHSFVSDALWPGGLEPTRLLRPWDSPGKNTGVVLFKQWASQVAPVVENMPARCGRIRDVCSIPGSGRSPGGGHGNSLQYPTMVMISPFITKWNCFKNGIIKIMLKEGKKTCLHCVLIKWR